MIVEKATGKRIADYASEKLWKQIGTEYTAKWSLDHFDGQEKSFCCFYSTARDFARLGQLYLNNGKWNGRQILSEHWVREATTPASNLVDKEGKPNQCYGYQWWIMNQGNHRVFYARGILGQYIAVIPDMKIVMVRLGKQRGEKRSDNHLTDFVTYIDEVIKIYGSG
jgi:CubicO group peptidase (beta-lactamase class C family)